ncbi:MAG: hypothetical protein M1830_007310 [Pleopsidium flavum]|nr:MAG: hypothetical protein M1830_007310 [Pleopsidium flavum]
MVVTEDEVQRLLRLFDASALDPDPVSSMSELQYVMKTNNISPLHAARTLLYLRNTPTAGQSHSAVPPWSSEPADSGILRVRNREGHVVGLPKGGGSTTIGSDSLDYNSCAIDCLVMAVKLLGIGCFASDRGGLSLPDWERLLNPCTREIQQLLLSDVTSIDTETLLRNKMPFFDACITATTSQTCKSSYLTLQSLEDLWSNIYANVPSPFRLSVVGHGRCFQCQYQYELDGPDSHQSTHHVVSLWMPRARVSVVGLLARLFAPRDCHDQKGAPRPQCKNSHPIDQLHWHAEHDLPDVLSLIHGSWYHYGQSTPRAVSFKYERTDGKVVQATYRWLGGIYFHPLRNHYKVYWRCDKEQDGTWLLEYDSSSQSNMVQVPAASDDPDDMIPSEWWKKGALVFMERVYDQGETRSQRLEELRRDWEATQDQREVGYSTGYPPLTEDDPLIAEFIEQDAPMMDSHGEELTSDAPLSEEVDSLESTVPTPPQTSAITPSPTRGPTQQETTRYYNDNPAFAIISRRPVSTRTSEETAAQSTPSAPAVTDFDDNPFRASHKPRRASSIKNEPSSAASLRTVSEYIEKAQRSGQAADRPDVRRSRQNAAEPVNYEAAAIVQRYRARHGSTQEPSSLSDSSEQIPRAQGKEGAGFDPNQDAWVIGQPLNFQEAEG